MLLITGAALALAAGVAGFLAARLYDGLADRLLGVHVSFVLLGYTATFFAGALAICYVAARPFHTLNVWQARSLARAALGLNVLATALTAVGVLLGAVWAREHLGRYWGWDPREVGGALVLAWDVGVVLWLWRRPAGDPAAVFSGVAGNVVVALAWFGPVAVAGRSAAAAALGLFVLSQVAALGLALVPPGRLRGRRA